MYDNEGFLGGTVVKNLPANIGDTGDASGKGTEDPLRGGNDNALQYSYR